jgi:hypothetical protein
VYDGHIEDGRVNWANWRLPDAAWEDDCGRVFTALAGRPAAPSWLALASGGPATATDLAVVRRSRGRRRQALGLLAEAG